LIRSVKFADVKKFTERVLKLSTGREVEDLCKLTLEKLAPNILTTDNG